MALSNIFREPRREITETLAGLLAISVPLWLDYRFGVWFQNATSGPKDSGCPWIFGMIFGLIGGVICFLILLAIHALGEEVCASLARRGLEIRPRDRR